VTHLFSELEQSETQNLLNAVDTASFARDLSAAAQRLNFDYCAFGMRMPLPVSNPKFSIASNYPVAWQARYAKENYLTIDPTVAHGTRSVSPIIWDGAVGDGAREFWEDAQGHGLKFGWAQSFIGANGATGMLTLSRSHEAISRPELRENIMRMTCLVQVAHAGMSRLVSSTALRGKAASLSIREIEVLRWCADGKTSGEAAQIMGISERTVNFHITNALEKLGTNNRTAGVVKAAMLRLL
jgi:LuxR family quorum-sensing system transcriptional regulator SolR